MEKTIYKSLNYPSIIYLIYILKGNHGRILLKFQRVLYKSTNITISIIIARKCLIIKKITN